MTLRELTEAVGTGIDVAGILAIVTGSAIATVRFTAHAVHRRSTGAYDAYRRNLGRAILLGLEFLVAADIIRTVAIAPTFASVGVLGAIVVIRTVLSIALHVETEGRWPWRAPGSIERQEGRASVGPERPAERGGGPSLTQH